MSTVIAVPISCSAPPLLSMSPPMGSEYNRVGDTTPLVPFVGVAVLVAFGLMAATQACLLPSSVKVYGVIGAVGGLVVGMQPMFEVAEQGCGAWIGKFSHRKLRPHEVESPVM